jgi:DNA-binding response OmpR family regulator
MEKDTIYVTDDDPGIRDLVAEYLTSQGYSVETAETRSRSTACSRPGCPTCWCSTG